MNKLIIFSFLLVSFVLFAKENRNKKLIPDDDPRKFNWTSPDLFRWSLNAKWRLKDIKENLYNYIEDSEKVVLRGKKWSCKVDKTERSTWTYKRSRFFKESRVVICSSGSFKSEIRSNCALGLKGKKVVFMETHSSTMYVGVGDDLNRIYLACHVWHDINQNNKNESSEWGINIQFEDREELESE